MTNPSRLLSACAAIALVSAVLLLESCALIQPPPVPGFGLRRGSHDTECTADVARAHAAFAAAGAAAGDPAATAIAHADAAAAMAAFHSCLATR